MRNILVLILFLNIGCSPDFQSDEALLEKDRKAMFERLKSSKVTTYKFGKILVRASAANDTVSQEYQKFKSDIDRIFNTYINADPQNLSWVEYLSIYRDYKKMEDFVNETDEDVFPTLFEAFSALHGDTLNSISQHLMGREKAYVQNIEHSILSVTSLLNKNLGQEISLYECSKIRPELVSDPDIKMLFHFFRGFLLFEKKLYYLSEDEVSTNIEWLNENENVDLPNMRKIFKWRNLDNRETHIAFHSLNHLFRGFDRLMMERKIDEERALKDFEIFLEDSRKIGVQNETIWAVEAYLYVKFEEEEKAISSLKKLSASPLLSSEEKEVIDKSIEYLKQKKSKKVLEGIYDKHFVGKIATKYMFSVLAEIDWKKILKEQNVPHTQEMFASIDAFNNMVENLNKYATTDNIKEKSESLWNKAKELTE